MNSLKTELIQQLETNGFDVVEQAGTNYGFEQAPPTLIIKPSDIPTITAILEGLSMDNRITGQSRNSFRINLIQADLKE